MLKEVSEELVCKKIRFKFRTYIEVEYQFRDETSILVINTVRFTEMLDN